MTARIPVELSIDPRLLPHDRDGRPGTLQLKAALARELASLVLDRGIPGRADVSVTPLDSPAAAPQDALVLTVHGRRVRYPGELFSRVWSTLQGQVMDRVRPVELDDPRFASDTVTIRAVCTTCRQILEVRPSVLLDDETVSRYAAGTPADSLEAAWLRDALGAVLDARLAIRNAEAVTRIFADLEGTLAHDAAESVIAAQRPRELVIAVRREYLRELTMAPHSEGFFLDAVRMSIAEHLGVGLPDFVFVDDPSMAPFGFSFRLNDVETLPWIGLPPDRFLVDEEPATLEVLGFAGAPALNPVTERDNTVVDRDTREALAEYHVTTWGPLAYLALCLESVVRRYAACLVDESTVRARLALLPSIQTAVTRTTMPPRRVARIMRALLAERVSVSNLPGILEALSEQEDVASEEARTAHSSPTGGPAWRRAEERRFIAAARERLARQVAAAVVPDLLEPRIPALVLDEQLHQVVASLSEGAEPLPAEEAERVNRGVRKALDAWTGPRWPALLTTTRVRADLRAALHQEFPALVVIAYEELPVDVELEIAATIEA